MKIFEAIVVNWQWCQASVLNEGIDQLSTCLVLGMYCDTVTVLVMTAVCVC